MTCPYLERYSTTHSLTLTPNGSFVSHYLHCVSNLVLTSTHTIVVRLQTYIQWNFYHCYFLTVQVIVYLTCTCLNIIHEIPIIIF
ncbi:unnamed protein product [Schistosoma mansoni]|uniref:Smp_202410 n=1 Tax=Schistosoma mansoni TaxID=6183 RepID=UPI00022C81FD|nr:unnamed protein product [Schistosoma mansoni]|eukprot:XP_018644651.1 unnamed protein product [Schistosoma mansoni]